MRYLAKVIINVFMLWLDLGCSHRPCDRGLALSLALLEVVIQAFKGWGQVGDFKSLERGGITFQGDWHSETLISPATITLLISVSLLLLFLFFFLLLSSSSIVLGIEPWPEPY